MALGSHLCRRGADHAAGRRRRAGRAGKPAGRRSRHHRRARQFAGQREPGRAGDDPAQPQHPAHLDRTPRSAGSHHRQPGSGVAALPAAVLQSGNFTMSTTKKLRLGPLPKTENVKLTFACPASLKADLDHYAALHAQAYGEAVDPVTLIPHMLEAFMAGDRGFKRSGGPSRQPKMKSRLCVDRGGFRIGARGRTRTDKPCGGGFSSHFGFRRRPARAGRSWSGARLHHSLSAVGARRLLSTPSLEPFGSRAWLGISSNLRSGPSPSLTGFTSRVSPRRLKFGLSPLRLPIPPLGQDAHDTSTTATTDLEPASVALTPSWLLARKASFRPEAGFPHKSLPDAGLQTLNPS